MLAFSNFRFGYALNRILHLHRVDLDLLDLDFRITNNARLIGKCLHSRKKYSEHGTMFSTRYIVIFLK